MPRAAANKLYKTFTKGLITEAGPLTYPENASTDELNTVIKVKGSRSRRLGLDYEPSSVPVTIDGMEDSDFVAEFSWKGVGNDSAVNFLVVQVNGKLHFFNMDAVPITGSKKAFVVDLLSYQAPFATADQVSNNPVQMASGKGWLFVASPFIEPLVLEYVPATDTITILKVTIQMRDFDGVSDSLGNEDQPATLTKEHFYNLRNQGWVNPSPAGVLEGAGTADPYTAPSPPASGLPGYIDPYDGNVHPNLY